jgi:hypothetical protein
VDKIEPTIRAKWVLVLVLWPAWLQLQVHNVDRTAPSSIRGFLTMRSEYQEQRRRLEEVSCAPFAGRAPSRVRWADSYHRGQLRRVAELRNAQQTVSGNSVVGSRDAGSSQEMMMMRGGSFGTAQQQQRQDPLIYPGLYSPSGFDMMGILVSV